MSSMVFEQPDESMSVTRRLTRWATGTAGAIAVALAVASCGGGAGGGSVDATPTVQAARPDQVAAFALAQQSVIAPLALAQTPSAAGNMLVDGGFESGATGWVNWGNAGVVSGQASSGTSALSVGTGAGGAGQEVGGIVPGSTYRLTAQAKVSAASETVYVGVNFIDQSGAPFTQNAQLVTSTAYTSAGFDVVAPPNAVRALVYVWKNVGSGLATVDDFAFGVAPAAAAGTASAANLVTNAAFENGMTGWDNWGNDGTTTAQPASGVAAAQVGTGAGGFGQRVAVVGGSTYRLGAQAKVSIPGETGYLGVMFTDAGGHGLMVQNAVFRSTTYSTAQADVTAPANATQALVFVWKNAGTGFAYVDDVTLAQVTPGATQPPPAQAEVAVNTSGTFTPLPWGGWVNALSVEGRPVFQRYAADGSKVGPATLYAPPLGAGSAVALQGGGSAAVWLSSLGGGVQQVWTQAYDANGVALGSPVAVAQVNPIPPADPGTTVNPAAVPQLAPLVGGGYAVVWALPQTAGTTVRDLGVYSQRFDAQGQPAAAVQQAASAGVGFLDIVGTTAGGAVVSWGIQSLDSAGGARAYAASGAPLAAAQVAGSSWVPGAGPRGATAPLAGAGAVLVWQLRGQPLFVQFITGTGIAMPAQRASDAAPSFYALSSVAGLPDGGAVVTWTDLAAGQAYARRYGADGTPRGPQTRLNLVTTPTGSAPQIVVRDDGSFTISWDVTTGGRYARTFAANGLTAP